MKLALGRSGYAAAFVLQAALLVWIIAGRAMLLAGGAEIRLPVVPVDPHDLFRGDYVTLAYPISRIESDQIAGDKDFTFGDLVYLSLERDGDGWKAAALHRARPESGTFLKGTVTDVIPRTACQGDGACSEYRIAYNLEQFFVPEGTGRDLEKLTNGEHIAVDVAVGKGGEAMLKRLLVDGEVKYQEGFF
jgi:uncharacterized membrane-anchored protein